MLKTVSSVSGASGTVTQINTGTGLTGGPITTTGTISLANTAVTAATYGSANTVSQITIDAQGRITNASNVTISIPSSQITGLGTMATQNSNNITVTGGTINGVAIGQTTAGDGKFDILTANVSRLGAASSNASISSSSSTGAYSYGTLTYSDIGLVATYSNSANNAVQVVVQNSSNAANASTDFVVTNDTGTAYADFGINSSGLVGSGKFYTANTAYVYSGSIDMYVGTLTNNAVHFVANNSTTDAMVLNGNNTVTINTLAQSTSSNATFATASLPLVPAGYLIVNNNGTNVKIPYYAV